MMQNFLLQVLRLRLMVCGIYIIIMEDYILREIDKIGKLIEALLQKAGILRRSGAGEAVCETAWTELAEALDLDIDTLLAREDFIGVLIREYGFSDENLEKFAELLFDFAAASPDRDATVRLACGITAIYRYLDEKNAPLFPFGFGLSYTQFEISDIRADTDVIQANEPFHVTAKVRNAGNRAGETVIQLYSNVHVPGQLTPVRSLTDWQRICLGVGQQMKVTFELTLAQLSQLDAEGRTVTPRGKVRIAVGEDSHAPFTVTLPVEA